MNVGHALRLTLFVLASGVVTSAQTQEPNFPKTIEAGSAFSVHLEGSGQGTLYILGPGQALKRDVQLGTTTDFPAGSLSNAGHYVAFLGGGATGSSEFDVVPSSQPAELSFFAKPSRLPVSMRGGISGAVYVFDGYRNLIAAPTPVQFELSTPNGVAQTRSITTRLGAAWTEFDSTPQQGTDKFVARAGGVSSSRIVRQVPGDPCALKMSATPVGQKVRLFTDPVRDCNGNAVPDGTIVTFTQIYNGAESTADVPLKRGIAEVQMPAHAGATITVASGVVLGNQIRWEK